MTYIISEISNQWAGKIEIAEQMILQSKFGGADAVKVQLFGDDWKPQRINPELKRDYVSVSFTDLKRLKKYADMLHIDLFGSPLDQERLEWCIELELPYIKIGNGIYKKDKPFVERAVNTGRPVIISLDNEDIKEGKPFSKDTVSYLYTERSYPVFLENLNMPDFDKSFLDGYSDHASGLSACFYALARGATMLEKHFTLSKSWQKEMEAGHYGSMNVSDLQQLQQVSRDIRMLKNPSQILSY